MQNRYYSFVLDPHGAFLWQARQLVWSLRHFVNVPAEKIVVHIVDAHSAPEAVECFRKLQVEVVSVSAFPNHPYCNKLQQLDTFVDRDFTDVVLLDCDMIVRRPPPPAEGGIKGKPVDLGNPPFPVVQAIYQHAGLPIIEARSDIDASPTVFANANGGLYVIDRLCFSALAEAWKKWASWCQSNRALFGDYWHHIDQLSFAMAVAERQLPFQPLDRSFNFPTHLKLAPQVDCDPAVLHYHRAVTDQQLLKPVDGLPQVSQAIRDINSKLLAWRRAEFDNMAFWNARYALHPDLGSGIGSRGATLTQKQKLLKTVAGLVDCSTILDVGGGDGQTAAVLDPAIRLHAIDVARAAEHPYRQANPHALWSQHDIVQAPADIKPDLVVCLDVLIHIPAREDYRAAVRNLLSHGVPVLISGFDAPAMDHGAMTYFHEPLSQTLTECGYTAVPVDGYRELVAFLALPAQKSPSTRDITQATLRQAIPLVENPHLLFEAIQRSRKSLGFFPDHLPRCIEYPWIVQQLAGRSGLTVMDAGAGVSVLPFMLAERGHSVITCDPHDLVRNGTPVEGWNEWGYLDYAELDPRIRSLHLPYEATDDALSLDVVLSVSVLEHLVKALRLKWIEKAFRQLNAGGLLLLTVDTVPFSDALWNFSMGKRVEDPTEHGSLQDLLSEITSMGFELQKVETSPWLPCSRVGMARIRAAKPA